MTLPSPSRSSADRAVLDSFRGQVAPVAVSGSYRVGLLLVAALMVLLPVVYLALIAGAGWGVWWHATENADLLRTWSSKKAALVAYGGPLFAGAVLVFFMIKPLFAPRAKKPPVRSLRREDEPLLFGFVERVAAAVGAPAPRRIDVDCEVNASASFRRGLFSMAGDDLVLTIGLPLVTGMSLAQLAGVLAHEFGHFAQGAGMRLSYVIRSVNWWFVRVVYQRDRWDASLEEARSSENIPWIGNLMVMMAQGAVWLTRRLLAGLMHVGHAASCYLLRQMEYDADRYEARLVGPAVFTTTVYELGRLSLARQSALDDVGAFYRDGRLPGDLPGLVAINRTQLEPAMIEKVDEHVRSRRTGRFDTHPADVDRIASAERETVPPVFTSELPASALFRDLDGVAHQASLDFYRNAVGEEAAKARVIDMDELATRKRAEGEERQAMARFFQSVANPLRPLPLPAAIEPAKDAAWAAAEVRQAREALAARAPALHAAWKEYDDVDTVLLQCVQARAVVGVGFKPNREQTGIGTAAELKEKEDAAQPRLEALGATLAEGEAIGVRRLEAALSLLLASDEPWAVQAAPEVPRLLDSARAVGAQLRQLVAIRDQRAAIAALAGQAAQGNNDEKIGRAMADGFARLSAWHSRLAEALSKVAYPFDHAGGNFSIAAFAIPRPAEGVAGSFEASGQAIGNLYGVYFRSLGRLAALAERVEVGLGLDPLPAPPAAPPAVVAAEA